MDRTPGAVSKIGVTVALTAMGLLGTGLRILYLGKKSFWWDEVATVEICSSPWPQFWQWLWRREANMTLYYLLVRGWLHFGDGEATVRLLSVVFSVASIPVIYLVAQRAFDRSKAGLFAALLLAVNTASIAYSQEARSYSLLVLLCLLSLYFFLDLPEGRTAGAAAYVAVSALAVYMHFFAVFFLAGQWCSLFWLRKNGGRWRPCLWPIALTLVLISPALYYMAFRNSGQLHYTPAVHLRDWLTLIYFLAADRGRFHRLLGFLYLLCCAVGVGRRLAVRRADPNSPQMWKTVVLLCCAVVPAALPFLLSFRTPMFAMHYLLTCLPAFVLLAADGIAELRVSWLTWGIAGCIVVLSMGTVRWHYAHAKDDWRGLTAYIVQHGEPGDAIAGFPAGAEWPVRHYVARSPQRTASYLQFTSSDIVQAEVAQHRTAGVPLPAPRLWVVTWGATCDPTTLTHLAPEYSRVEWRPFDGGVALALYASADK